MGRICDPSEMVSWWNGLEVRPTEQPPRGGLVSRFCQLCHATSAQNRAPQIGRAKLLLSSACYCESNDNCGSAGASPSLEEVLSHSRSCVSSPVWESLAPGATILEFRQGRALRFSHHALRRVRDVPHGSGVVSCSGRPLLCDFAPWRLRVENPATQPRPRSCVTPHSIRGCHGHS